VTAISLFKTADAAILLTDQATMSGGRLAMIGSKVVSAPHLSMAVARSGAVSIYTRSVIANWLAARQSQAEAMGTIFDLLGLVREDADRNGGHVEPEPAKLFIALWEPETNVPECYFVDEKLVGTLHCDSPPSKEPFDAERAALIRRIEDQRRVGADNIGAAAELTIVSRDGITSEIIHFWPDRIGEPIPRIPTGE
jgi:hypothetical protein